jgi:hypothetical protein
MARFLNRFRASSAAVLHEIGQDEFEVQQNLLKTSFYYSLLVCRRPPKLSCREHATWEKPYRGAGRQIATKIYDLWIGSLLQTVEEHDPLFDPSVADAWRRMITYGIEHLPPGREMNFREGDSDRRA